MPIAAAVPAIIGAVGSVVGGVVGAKGAGGAAQIQNQAAQQAAQQVQTVGNAAAAGIDEATGTAIQGVNAATGTAIDNANTATGTAIEDLQTGTNQANQTLETGKGNELANLAPYLQAGQQALGNLADLTSPDGELGKKFQFGEEDFKVDPGYKFILDQGSRALERGAAARGSVVGGGTLKALSRYASGLADTTYNQAYSRAADTFRINRDGTLARAGILSTLTGVGERATAGANSAERNYSNLAANNQMTLGNLTAGIRTDNARWTGTAGIQGATTAGQFGQQGAQIAGGYRLRGAEGAADYLTAGSAAQAAGRVGKANAYRGMIGGLSNALMDGFYASKAGSAKKKLPGLTGVQVGM